MASGGGRDNGNLESGVRKMPHNINIAKRSDSRVCGRIETDISTTLRANY